MSGLVCIEDPSSNVAGTAGQWLPFAVDTLASTPMLVSPFKRDKGPSD